MNHNFGLCRKCGKTHISPTLGRKHTDEAKKKLSAYAKLRTGDKNPKWRGGHKTIDGYLYIYSPEHPNRTKQKYVAEHRLIMEKHLGRYLDPSEIVHHIDHDRTNNAIENLKLLNSNAEHQKEHPRKRDSKGRFLKE